MTVREWIHQRAITIGKPTFDRVYSNTSIREDASTRSLDKPFIVHRFATDRSDLRGDDRTLTVTEQCQFFVHDIPGDYTQVDEVLSKLRGLFDGVTDQANGIIRVDWLEDSEDFRDDAMGTILRYGRYQIKHKEITS